MLSVTQHGLPAPGRRRKLKEALLGSRPAAHAPASSPAACTSASWEKAGAEQAGGEPSARREPRQGALGDGFSTHHPPFPRLARPPLLPHGHRHQRPRPRRNASAGNGAATKQGFPARHFHSALLGWVRKPPPEGHPQILPNRGHRTPQCDGDSPNGKVTGASIRRAFPSRRGRKQLPLRSRGRCLRLGLNPAGSR